MLSKAGTDIHTSELLFATHKALRGHYVLGIERAMSLVSNLLTLMASGPDTGERLEHRQHAIALVERFYQDMTKECYAIRPLDPKWLNGLKKRRKK